ncbi:glycosyltransferase family 39 protein [Candidatus Leptofilum sp.]|uniref:glycosyltransferase family 39 protein n=1 Tax=Candidatus Leptofilum sp. TaxID=3241576 RepID=UPI003B599CEF
MEIFPTPQAIHRQPVAGWLSRLTVADGLLGIILLAAAVLRLANLGYLPLSDAEAAQTLAVWSFWQPETAVIAPGSPAYFSLTGWLTQLFGFGDGVMRLVSALFGMGLVYLPWLLRHRLGTQGALVTAVLLTISPLGTLVSRTAGGDSIALFALLLLLIAFIRYQETAATRWLYTLFGALGLGLASSALFYSGLATLLLAWFVHARLGLSLFVAGWQVQPTETNWRKGTAVGLAIFLLLSSFFLLLPTALGASAGLAGEWFQQFGGELTLDPLLAFVRYEPALVVLGLVGLLWAIVRGYPLALFAVYWFSGGLILLLLQRNFMSNALLLTLPTALLAGIVVNAAWRRRWGWFSGITAMVTLGGIFVLLVNIARLGRIAQINPQESTLYLIVILLTVLFVGLVLYFAASEEATAVSQGILLALLGFAIFYQWGAGWWLGQQAANDPRERWVQTGTDLAIRELDETVQTLSRQLANSDTALQIGTTLNVPALNWYLREYNQLEQLDALPLAPNQQVIITDFNPNSRLATGYSGTDFAIRRSEPIPPDERPPTAVYDTFRWWFFHDSTAVAPAERAIVWVRADLINGQP